MIFFFLLLSSCTSLSSIFDVILGFLLAFCCTHSSCVNIYLCLGSAFVCPCHTRQQPQAAAAPPFAAWLFIMGFVPCPLLPFQPPFLFPAALHHHQHQHCCNCKLICRLSFVVCRTASSTLPHATRVTRRQVAVAVAQVPSATHFVVTF